MTNEHLTNVIFYSFSRYRFLSDFRLIYAEIDFELCGIIMYLIE